MNPTRRTLIKTTTALGVLLAAGVLSPRQARAAASRDGFAAKTLVDAMASVGGAPAASTDIVITAPDIAENGAVVPVGVASNIAGTSDIFIFVEKNPFPLAAVFQVPDGTLANVNTRIKMGQSSNIVAVVKTADGKLFTATKETKVTLGGCGG